MGIRILLMVLVRTLAAGIIKSLQYEQITYKTILQHFHLLTGAKYYPYAFAMVVIYTTIASLNVHLIKYTKSEEQSEETLVKRYVPFTLWYYGDTKIGQYQKVILWYNYTTGILLNTNIQYMYTYNDLK